jgi:hypothetical protein
MEYSKTDRTKYTVKIRSDQMKVHLALLIWFGDKSRSSDEIERRYCMNRKEEQLDREVGI